MSLETIERKLIVPHVKLGISPFIYLLSGAMALTIIGIPFAVMLIMAANLWVLKRATVREQKRTTDAFVDFIGAKPQYFEATAMRSKASERHVTGTGIALHEGKLYMLDDGEAACIPWDKIRSWTWEVAGYSKIDSGSFSSGYADAERNRAAKGEAAMMSGFFVRVSDINKPEWQFITMDTKVLKKWEEIFKQLKVGPELKAA